MLGSAVPPCRTMIFSGGQFLAGGLPEFWACDVSGAVGVPCACAEDELVEPGFAFAASHVVNDGAFVEFLFLARCFAFVVDGWAAVDEGLGSCTAVGVVPSCFCVDCALEEEADPDCCVDWAGAAPSCALNPVQ